jgi:hypothetical protein
MLQTNTARPSTHPPCIAGSYLRPTSPLPNRTHTMESDTARDTRRNTACSLSPCAATSTLSGVPPTNRSPSVVTAASPPESADRALRSGAPTAAVRHPHRPNYLSLQRPSDSSSGSPQCSHFRQSAGAPGILTGTWPRCAHSSSSRACRVSYHRGPGGIGGQSTGTHLASARILCLGSSVLIASSHMRQCAWDAVVLVLHDVVALDGLLTFGADRPRVREG